MQAERANLDGFFEPLFVPIRPILKKWRAFLSSSSRPRAGGGVAYIEYREKLQMAITRLILVVSTRFKDWRVQRDETYLSMSKN